MAKYGIGDKVRVRDDLKYEEWYYMCTSNETQMANEEMVEKAGQIVTIKDFDKSGCYYIEEDCWHWTDEMFSGLSETTKKYPVSDLKVGDRVRVRPDLEEGKKYYMKDIAIKHIVNDEMYELKGKIVTISEIRGSGYSIKEDDGEWYWTDEMFSERVEEVTRKFKVGDIVRFRNDLFTGMSIFSEEGKSLKILSQMSKYAGQEAVITGAAGATDACYTVDTNSFCWYAGAFEDKIIDKSISDEEKEDKPSLLEYQIEHQHDIPKRLFCLAEKYPNVTWKKAREYYVRAVEDVILETGEKNLFSGILSFGRGLNEAAARFEELLKLEEKAVSLKSTVGTVATFEGVPVFESEMPNPVSDDERTSKKMDCFSCTSADCANCENFKYKMAII